MPFPTIAHTERSRRIVFAASVGALLVLAILLALGGARGPRADPRGDRGSPAGRAARGARVAAVPVPQPAVEPLELIEMTPDRARLINSMVSFVGGVPKPAPPFRLTGSAVDRASAVACLASAGWYEAGDDPVGQRAVVQVVLNRVRHPAYPKSVCGVVFQGAERRTGCQFSFTCDGAMARRPSDAAWARAEGVADAALAGAVDASVGYATHYHTDWVVPYWSASLDKLSRVGTHLFFRWRGYWGQPGAFRGKYAGGEIVDSRVPGAALLATADGVPVIGPLLAGPDGKAAGGAAGTFAVPDMPGDDVAYLRQRPVVAVPGVPAAKLGGHVVRAGTAAGPDYALELDPAAAADDYPVVAQALCRDLPSCTVGGWIDPDRVAGTVPIKLSALRTATFVYRRTAGDAAGRSHWNCRQAPRADRTQCLPGTE